MRRLSIALAMATTLLLGLYRDVIVRGAQGMSRSETGWT